MSESRRLPYCETTKGFSLNDMQCVRCGKVLNLEDRRCPKCFASLSNQQIGQMEVTRHQLAEIADIERAGMTSRQARKGAVTGAMIGGIGLLMSFSLTLILASLLVGCIVGWFVAWRRWGVVRTALGYCGLMVPLVILVEFNPFSLLAAVCTGGVLGWAMELSLWD